MNTSSSQQVGDIGIAVGIHTKELRSSTAVDQGVSFAHNYVSRNFSYECKNRYWYRRAALNDLLVMYARPDTGIDGGH